MKYCPICEKTYSDEVEVCEVDGTLLREVEVKQDPLIGKMIKGRYRVIEKIGEGGMGTVYLAEQVSIGRKVALKILHPEFARDQEFVKRFRQEARLAASLNHRNVITVFDFDQGDDGSLFIAMEYVQGQSLSDVVRQEGPLDLARAVRLGIQIAEGLGAAHRAGVIHRDIKPENIMVVGDAADEIKLMDFGIARLRDTGAATRLTRSGMILGTPVYMAPEQIEGGEVTERTDIYAFGIVLYEMLSGSVPFSAPTPSAVLLKHLKETPVPLRKLRKEIPPPFERVVMHALEKKPDARQRNMDELVEGLKAAERALQSAYDLSSAAQRVPAEKRWGGLRSLWKSGELFSRLKRTPSEEILAPKPESRSVEDRILRRAEKPEISSEQEPAPETVVVEGPERPLAQEQTPETVLPEKPEIPLAPPQQTPEKVLTEKPEAPLVQQQAPETVVVERPETPLARQEAPETVLATRPLAAGEWAGRTRKFKWKEIGIGVGVLMVVVAAIISGRYMFFQTGNKERPPETRVVGLSIRAQKDTLIADEQMRLGIKAQFSDGKQSEMTEGIEWQSSNPAVAAVSPDGEVIARKAGKAEISASHAGLRTPPLMLVVKAKEPESPPPPIAKLPAPTPAPRLVSLTVHSDKRDLKVKERTALAVEGKYSDGKVAAISYGVEWQSSDQATAEVNSKGEVTAQKEGKVNITARYAGITSSALTLSIKGGTESNESAQEPKTESIQEFRRRLLR